MLTGIDILPKPSGRNNPFELSGYRFWHIPLICSLLLSNFLNPSLGAQTFFVDQASEKGVTHYYGVGVAGGGVSFIDFDQDGWDDLTLATEFGKTIAFYRNTNGTFDRIPSLVPNLDEVKQLLWVDIDNDGDKDLFLTTLFAVNRLYENLGDLQLKDITAEAGLSMIPNDSYGAAMADVDRDGWIDIYVTERSVDFSSNRNYLYRNLGDNTFEEVAAAWGVKDPGKAPFFPAFFDMNNDNWPDIYIAQDKSQGNTLLLHNGPSGGYTDISVAAGADLIMNAMGIAVGDHNCDGWQDLYISNTPHGNALLVNNQNGGFLERAEVTGTTFNGTAWGTHFFDADNDGFEDLYVSGSAIGAGIISSAFYYNDQQGSFYEEEAGFVGDTVSSYGNAVGDYNKDGQLDILVVNTGVFPAQLWSNEGSSEQTAWLKVSLEGVISNLEGLGARVQLYDDSHYQLRYQHAGMGFLGQNTGLLHFGLGTTAMIDSLTVTWPTGHIDRFYQILPNQILNIQEGSSTNGEITVEDFLVSDMRESRIEENWQVFPNPAHSSFTMAYPGAAQGRLQLYNLAGHVVRSWDFTSDLREYSLGGLRAGTYVLQWMDQNRLLHQKLLITP